ncbi:hypothetical protein CQW23_35492 [Capsicum baccatum]|uniref:Uncharacterized protein n=1 Tax=Capsicum baccatum TaxID=33114 RepID=A0A2G2UVV2_CAPBA|nr:hypothetical protein CQW23_35492 [Capsicum baccatum]
MVQKIFLLKFLCDEVLNSAILRDHIDRSASLSAELQQKLRSLSAELKLLKYRREILTAKLKNNARSSGDTGSDTSLWSNDCKLKVQGPDSGSHNSSIAGGCRQLDDGTQHNQCNDYSKQSCLYTSKTIQHKTCASGSSLIKNSPDPINHLQHQQLLKDNTGSLNTSSHAKCGTEDVSLQNDISTILQQETDQMPGNRLESAQSSSKSLRLFATQIMTNNTISGSTSNPLEEAYLSEISALKEEIRTSEGSIAAKELELQEVSVRKEYMGQDSEGRFYWTFGRPTSSLLVAHASTSRQSESAHLWSYAPWENMGIPNLDQWTCYQSDVEIEVLVRWLREQDTREKELKESIWQWRDNRTMIYNYMESPVHNKVGLSTFPSEDSGSCTSDSLDTRAISAIKKMIDGCLAEEETEFCQDMGVKVRVFLDGEVYRNILSTQMKSAGLILQFSRTVKQVNIQLSGKK